MMFGWKKITDNSIMKSIRLDFQAHVRPYEMCRHLMGEGVINGPKWSREGPANWSRPNEDATVEAESSRRVTS